MHKTNTAFYDGFVSSFFLLNSTFKRRTKHFSVEMPHHNANEQDWQAIGGDFKRASEKVVSDLNTYNQSRLANFYRHV